MSSQLPSSPRPDGQPPVVSPNEFRTESAKQQRPLSIEPVGSRAKYAVGCIGVLVLLAIGAAIAAAIYLGRQASADKSQLARHRPDVASASSMPPEVRSAVNGTQRPASSQPIRKWETSDEEKLASLLVLVDAADESSIDLGRLAVEMRRLRPMAVLPMTEALWALNLNGSVVPPEIYQGAQVIDARWISESEARVIVLADGYYRPELFVVYLIEKDGAFRIYDWRETLQPLSEAQYWAEYVALDEPECYRYSELTYELDGILNDPSLADEQRAGKMYAVYAQAELPESLAAMGQNIAAIYLENATDSEQELRRVVDRMQPSGFAGAYVWKAKLAEIDDPQQAFSQAMRAIKAAGWHPAAASIVLSTAKTDAQFQSASAVIARSLHFGGLGYRSHRLFTQEPEVIASVLKELFARTSTKEASVQLVEALYECSWLPPKSWETLRTAMSDVNATPLVSAYIGYCEADFDEGAADACFSALQEVVRHKMPAELAESMVREFFTKAVEVDQLSSAIDQIRNSKHYDGETLRTQLALAIHQSDESQGDLRSALPVLNSETTADRAARAMVYDSIDQRQKAWEMLVELWPERERELLDQDEYYDLDYSNAALTLASRLAIDLEKQQEFMALGSNRIVAGTALAYEYSQRGDYKELRAHLDTSGSAVDFLPYWRGLCGLMLDPGASAEQVAMTIKWINENSQDDGYWAIDNYVSGTAPHGADPWDMRECLFTLAIDAGVLPDLWDALTPNERKQLMEEHLYESLYAVSGRVQLSAMRDRVRDHKSEYQSSLLNEIQSRLLLLEGKPLESTRAWLQHDLSEDDRAGSVEQRLLLQLAGIGRIDLYDGASNEIPEEARGEQHEQWRKLAVDLGESNGDAVLDNPVFEHLDWENDHHFLQVMHRCGIVASTSQLSPVSTDFSHTPAVLLQLRGSWESVEPGCVKKFDDWDRVEEIGRFPRALAVWTREDPQGRWAAAVYDQCPPGLDAANMPEGTIGGKLFIQIAHFNSTRIEPADTALYAFATGQLAGWAAIDSICTSSQSIAWPRQGWPQAIGDHMATGRLDLRWVDYEDCWTDYWPKYSLPQFENEDVFVLNFGGIVEQVPCDTVSEAADESESTTGYDWPVYRLSQPSISFPVLATGTHVR